MIKKILSMTVAGMMSCTLLFAQNDETKKATQHEVSAIISGGLSTLHLGGGHSSLDASGGAGGSFGAGYEYRITDKLSVGTGLELSLYNAKASLNTVSDRYASNDGEYPFEFRTTVSDCEETQRAMFLNIPLLVRFRYPATGKTSFYGGGGFKFGIPLSGKYTVTKASMKNSGYYAVWSGGQQELVLDTQEFMGFGTFRRSDVKGDLDLKLACMLSLEAGVSHRLSDKLNLYVGAYFDYGLNDVAGTANKRLVEYNAANPPAFVNNSLLSSQYTENGKTERLTGKVVPMSVGLKVSLGFGL